MGHKSKTPKGEISITNYKGRMRLRWRYNGTRYSLNLPNAYSRENLPAAGLKSAEIKLDLLKGCFDTSLVKYKNEAIVEVEPTKITKASKPQTKQAEKQNLSLSSLVPDFKYWTKNIKSVDIENSVDYLSMRNLLKGWINTPVDLVAEKLNARNWVAITYNKRLTCLFNFLEWLVQKGTITSNPLKNVSRRRNKKSKKNPKRNPLSEGKILGILEAIRNDTYCPAASNFKHSHYYPFLYFLFLTGVRSAEAIGLRVKHIDTYRSRIEISEAFARTVKGSNHSVRISKGTKTDNVRYLPLTPELGELLIPLI